MALRGFGEKALCNRRVLFIMPLKGDEKMQRYDTNTFTAKKTDEGFILDAPVVGRSGLLRYLNADGSERWEYRPPEEAFNADSLKSIRGKPVTLGHHGLVNGANADSKSIIGSVLSEGRQDGETIKADIALYSLPTDARELSCGYTLDLEEKPGTTPDGKHYDAIQRNIKYNHVAVVKRGRAGIARLNMDGNEILEDEPKEEKKNMDMVKVKVESGISYDAAPEVGVYVENLKKQIAEDKKAADAMQAKYDSAIAELDKAKKEQEKKSKEDEDKFAEAVKARCALMEVAKAHKVEKADSMSDKEIKLAVIKAVRGDSLNLEGKSEDYINAAFDFACQQHDDSAVNKQTKTVNKPAVKDKENEDEDDPKALLEALKKAEAEAWTKEVR